MKPLHILVATPLGRGGKGGIDRMMDNVRMELAKNPSENMTVRFAATRGGGHIFFSPFFLLAFLTRMVTLRLLGRCDLVHINLASRGSTWRKLAVGALARTLKIPYIIHLHGGEHREFVAGAGPALQRNMRCLYTNASRVVVLGQVWRRFVEERLAVAPGRVVVLPNATPRMRLEHWIDAEGMARVLYLGELGSHKGTPQLVEALARLKDWPDWRAVLAGNGEVDKTRGEIGRLGLSGRVSVPGWIGPEETENLLAGSDILVLPSFAENLPMSVIEGMANGLAIVASPVGAIPDIIRHEETGILIPPGDVEALAGALKRLITDADLRTLLGASARAFHRENLEMSEYIRKLTTIWQEAIA